MLGEKAFKAADPDNDGSLSKDEYLALVEKLFKKADPDNDGTLDATELKSKSGTALRKLIG
jgi:Ca2+-binding EF-hand superfamily protein